MDASTVSFPRKPFPSDVSDEEWAFVAPYLGLVIEADPELILGCRQRL